MRSFIRLPFFGRFDWHWHDQIMHSALYRELTLALLVILFLLFAAMGLNM